MAAPNIVNVTTIIGKTAVLAVGTSAGAIVSNSAGSGKVLKVNLVTVANVDGTNNSAVTADLYRSSVPYRLASTVTVPADAALVLMDRVLYLEEGDSLRLTASTSGDLEAICSYEEIS